MNYVKTEAIAQRYEYSLIDLLRIFLEVKKKDYYDKKTIKYEDLIERLNKIVLNPSSIKG